MSEVLGRILAFERAITDRSVQRRVPFPFGTAFFHDGLPRVWDLNFLQVESAEPTVCDLVEEAERLQGGAGLERRKIAVDDEGLSRRLEPGFRELEWKVEALVVMPHRRKPTRSADLATTRELSAADLRQNGSTAFGAKSRWTTSQCDSSSRRNSSPFMRRRRGTSARSRTGARRATAHSIRTAAPDRSNR